MIFFLFSLSENEPCLSENSFDWARMDLAWAKFSSLRQKSTQEYLFFFFEELAQASIAKWIFLHNSLERDSPLRESIKKWVLKTTNFYLLLSINLHLRFKVLHKVFKYIKHIYNCIQNKRKDHLCICSCI